MEDKNKMGMRDEDNLRAQKENTPYEEENANESSESKDSSGDDISGEGLESKHQQQHGNRKYEPFTNHSSASDQPGTVTGTGPGI